MSRSYNNFTHWAHEYMRRPPFSGLLEDTVLLKLASPCPEAAYLYDLSWEKESVFFHSENALSKVNDRLILSIEFKLVLSSTLPG